MPDVPVLWIRLRESLWFLPSLIVLGAIVLAVVLVELSSAVDAEALKRWPRIFGAGADGSRSMLSAIASSMITVAGVTFSITMVAVTQASTQYSPRILRNFMRDRANQAVLGVFVGIFAYCLVVLRTIRSGDDSSFVPSIAVLVGVLLAIVGIAVLIFFVHHIATTLQASEIISRITRDSRTTIRRLYPEEIDEEIPDVAPAALLGAVGRDAWCPVPAPETGYIQQADFDRLVRIADEAGLIIRMGHVVGDFVVSGQPMATYAPHPLRPGALKRAGSNGEELTRRIGRRYAVSTYRTLDQDLGFGIRQLVDIALKALSPGINDTTTAVTCVDYLGAILVAVANRRFRLTHYGKDDVPRVIAGGPTFEDLLALAVDEIRQQADGNVSVIARLLGMLGNLARATRPGARRRAVARQVELVHEVGQCLPAEHDREHIEVLARAARAAALESLPEEQPPRRGA